jgi:PTH1 family peptidyl-tRNA hydrolase
MAAASNSVPLVIIGLGNPGPRHAGDRHNVGFWLVEELARSGARRFREEAKLSAAACQVDLGGQSVRLLKPGTFMNRSGQAMRRVMDYYRVAPGEILVVHDDLDLSPGTARLKFAGGHGGHNGLRDIIEHCGAEFFRLRIGIGHPGNRDEVTDYVLHAPSKDERQRIDAALAASLRALDTWYALGFARGVQQLHSATPRAEPDAREAPVD